MSNTKRAKQPSLRELARNAKPRVDHYDIPVAEFEVAEAAGRRLAEASAALKSARVFSDPQALAAAEAALTEAREAYDACFRRVHFQGLTVAEADALANEHPEPEDGEPDVEFIYHMAVASCVDGEDMTAEDWKDLCDNVWRGRQPLAFRQAVLNANSREFADGIPKG